MFKEIQALRAIRNANTANDIALLELDARLAFISGTKTTPQRVKAAASWPMNVCYSTWTHPVDCPGSKHWALSFA
ncbi:hypothetical protein [Pseudomonas helvetica]|uniref:hypothetical protein n=1 Tax=Pseudomonas helvetica TaxID=3136738 RepID=UPI003265123C